MIVFGGLRVKTCLDCLNWMIFTLTGGEFSCLLLWITYVHLNVQEFCILHTRKCVWGFFKSLSKKILFAF